MKCQSITMCDDQNLIIADSLYTRPQNNIDNAKQRFGRLVSCFSSKLAVLRVYLSSGEGKPW